MSHRLELVLKDALQGTSFDDMDELLLQIYYLYEKSLKKLREQQEIHGKCKDIFDEGRLKLLREWHAMDFAYSGGNEACFR